MKLFLFLFFIVASLHMSVVAQEFDEFRLDDPKAQYQKELQTYNIANSFMKEGDFRKALDELKKLRNSNPLHHQIDILMGRCKMNLGEWVGSEEIGENAWYAPGDSTTINLYDNFDTVYKKARELKKAHKYQEAMQLYSKLAEHDPKNRKVIREYRELSKKIALIQKNLIAVGEDFYSRALFRPALKEWYKALYYNPDNEILLIKIEFAEQKLEELYNFYRVRLDMLEEEDDEKETIYFIETVFYQFPKDQFFKIKYRDLLVKREEHLNKMMVKGREYYTNKEFSKAEKLFLELKHEYPEEVQVQRWHGTVLKIIAKKENQPRIEQLYSKIDKALKAHKPSQAAIFFEQVKKLTPPNSALNQRESAIRLMKRERARDKKFESLIVEVKQNLKMYCYRDARFALNEALAIRSNNVTALHLKKEINKAKYSDLSSTHDKLKELSRLIKEKNFEEARGIGIEYTGNSILDLKVTSIKKTLKRDAHIQSIKVDEDKVFILLNEGIRMYRKENYAGALKKWKKILRLDPHNRTVPDWIENVKIKIKRLKK